jgi:hypothetical protein
VVTPETGNLAISTRKFLSFSLRTSCCSSLL